MPSAYDCLPHQVSRRSWFDDCLPHDCLPHQRMIAFLIRYPGGRGSIELEPKNLHGLRQSLDGVRRTMARPESPTAARLVSRSPPRDRKWNGSVSSGAAPSGPPSGDLLWNGSVSSGAAPSGPPSGDLLWNGSVSSGAAPSGPPSGDLLRPDGTATAPPSPSAVTAVTAAVTAPPSPSAELLLAAGSGERSAASAVSAAAASPVYSACRWTRSKHRHPAYVSAAAHVPGVGDVSVPTSAMESRRLLAEKRQHPPMESVDGTHAGLSAVTRKKQRARGDPRAVLVDGTAAVLSDAFGTYAVAGKGDPPATGRRLYVTTRSASAPKDRASFEVPKHETVLALIALMTLNGSEWL
jgi:hypothetical protein